MSHFAIRPYVEPDQLHPTVARAALGATFYLADAKHWAATGALQAFDAFLEHAPPGRLQVFNTSMINAWHPVQTEQGVEGLRAALPAAADKSLSTRLRHGFRFEYVDDAGAPCTGFSYTEADPARGDRCSTLEVSLPSQAAPTLLLSLAETIAGCGPYWCGIGGYAARWNWLRKRAAFDVIYRWCGRWLGLDVQDAEQMAWRARDGLPGTNWLNFVGDAWLSRNGVDGQALRGACGEHTLIRDAGEGLLLQAGAAPSEADVNLLKPPPAYEEIAKALSPHVVQGLEEYWGMFGGRKHTNIWLRRWEDLTAWDERRA